MKHKFSLKALVAGTVAALSVGVASASPVSNQLFAGFQQLSDNSAEYLVNANGSLCVTGGDCTVDVGDRLVGIFNISSIEKSGTSHLLGTGGVNELTGVFDVTIASKASATLLGITTFAYSFLATNTSGVAISLFDDSTVNYQRTDDGTGTKADRINALTATANGGIAWATLGLHSATSWTATAGTDNIADLGATPSPGNGGSFNEGLDFITNNSGFQFNKVDCKNLITGLIDQVDVCGSGSLLATSGNTTPFDSFDNIDFTVNRVPEPASLALVGLGLLGLGASRRRKV